MTDTFQIESSGDIEAVKNSLCRIFSGLAERSSSKKITLFDSFDWRLFKAKALLIDDGRQLAVIDLTSEAPICKLDKTFKAIPRFWWDFPESDLRDFLKTILDMRAALALLTTNSQTIWMGILNEGEKTVARIKLHHLATKKGTGSLSRLTLLPIKGYRREYQKAQEAIEKQAGIKRSDENQWAQLFHDWGLAPSAYTKRPDLHLHPQMAAETAVKHILLSLMGIMRANEDGVKNDIDTEFLHDFRVSVRKARSLLTQVKEVFSEEKAAWFKDNLKVLGKQTNQLRDLDVYLLEKDTYKQMLPEALQSGLNPLFQSLRQKQWREAKGIRAYLESADYQTIVEEIEAFCADQSPLSGGRQSQMPVIDIAQRVICKRFKNVSKKGTAITHQAPEDEFHSLRIDCKKLRYLLEFFQSLFPPSEMNTLIKQLKQLQDNLGLFNDLSVQQAFLYEKMNGVTASNKQAVPYAAALGALIAVLHQKQKAVRELFFDVFAGFNAKANRNLYKELFK